jgi:Peptidase inhibitor family I36
MNLRSQIPFRARGYRILAVAVALVSAVIIAVSSSAQAATDTDPIELSSSTDVPAPSCGASTLCTFQNANFNETTAGSRWDYAWSSRPHGVWFYVGSGANDKISSLYNHRGWTSFFGKNCPIDNNLVYENNESYDPNLNVGDRWQDGSSVNDSISAIALGTSTGHTPPPSNPGPGRC